MGKFRIIYCFTLNIEFASKTKPNPKKNKNIFFYKTEKNYPQSNKFYFAINFIEAYKLHDPYKINNCKKKSPAFCLSLFFFVGIKMTHCIGSFNEFYFHLLMVCFLLNP